LWVPPIPANSRPPLAFSSSSVPGKGRHPHELLLGHGGARVGTSARSDGIDEYAVWLIKHKAQRLIGRVGLTESDREDVEQELVLDLLNRLPDYDATRGLRSAFIGQVINHKVAQLIRDRRRKKRDCRCRACSLDDPLEQEDGSTIPREETVSQDDYDLRLGKYSRPAIERTDLGIDVSRALSRIPANLRDLAVLLMLQTKRDAARGVGVHRSTLYKSGLRRLRNAFEDAGLRDYL